MKNNKECKEFQHKLIKTIIFQQYLKIVLYQKINLNIYKKFKKHNQ